MATTPTPEEAIDRAKRLVDDRIGSIREAVAARQNVTDVRTDADRQRAELEAQLKHQLSEAERADVRAYNAALSAGWSVDELRKIGLREPEKKTRARRRPARKPATSTPPTETPPTSAP